MNKKSLSKVGIGLVLIFSFCQSSEASSPIVLLDQKIGASQHCLPVGVTKSWQTQGKSTIIADDFKVQRGGENAVFSNLKLSTSFWANGHGDILFLELFVYYWGEGKSPATDEPSVVLTEKDGLIFNMDNYGNATIAFPESFKIPADKTYDAWFGFQIITNSSGYPLMCLSDAPFYGNSAVTRILGFPDFNHCASWTPLTQCWKDVKNISSALELKIEATLEKNN